MFLTRISYHKITHANGYCGAGQGGRFQSVFPQQFFLFVLFILFYLFYFWLCWVFIAAHRLSLVAASGLLIVVASLVVEHRL